jgi:FKBP-type peptidyl-prolyl cis-trans isomerase (trigger factor)
MYVCAFQCVALWMVSVKISMPCGSCDMQHTKVVKNTGSGARVPGFRPSSVASWLDDLGQV